MAKKESPIEILKLSLNPDGKQKISKKIENALSELAALSSKNEALRPANRTIYDWSTEVTATCSCGEKINSTQKYCPNCGQKIDWTVEEPKPEKKKKSKK